MEEASLRTQFGPSAQTEAAKMLRAAGVQLVWSALDLKDAPQLKKWRQVARKILAGH